MSFLKNLEAKLEQLVEGGFKSAFKSEVQPVELARKLAKEMDMHKATSISRTYVPNEYTIFLSSRDREQFEGFEDGLRKELSGYLLEHARKRGYSLVNRPTVEFQTDSELDLGFFGILARLADAPAVLDVPPSDSGHTMVYSAVDLQEASPAAAAVARRAVLLVGDRRYVLAPPRAVVGRGNTSDVRVDDPNVSREHAEFRVEGGSWTVADLGSTNGTQVDGVTISGPVALRGGDQVEVGNTPMTFTIE